MKAKLYFVSTLIIYVALISNTRAQIGKIQAIDSVTSKMTSQELSDYNVLCYPELIQGNEFNLTAYHVLYSPYDTSWLFFTDMIPMAQWDHDCKYLFVDQQTGNITEINSHIPPTDYWYGWEFINYPYPYPQNNHNNDSIQVYSQSINPDPHKYAVLLCWNEGEACRWNNLSHIYCGIKRNYGFMDENIFVLSGNGTLPDTLSPNLDNEFPINDFDGPCTKDSISDVFNYLSQTLTNEDILFVYATTHGEKWGQDTSYLRLWNYDSLFDHELAEMLSDIQCSEKIMDLMLVIQGDLEIISKIAIRSSKHVLMEIMFHGLKEVGFMI